MFDARLRPWKDRLLAPLVRVCGLRVPVGAVTAVSVALGLGAAVTAGVGASWWALGCWLLSRVADGLDGALARARGTASDAGGFADLLGDVVVYAAVPIGVAVAAGDVTTWSVVAVLLGTYYVNAVAWLFLSAVRARDDGTSAARTSTARTSAAGSPTTIPMPTGLVEGTETIVLTTAVLAFPSAAAGLLAVNAGLVACTVVQRVWWARRVLR